MDWRKASSEPDVVGKAAQKDGSVESCSTQDSESKIGSLSDVNYFVVPSAARKPSERFMRRSLQAKSKASTSERYRMATLKEKMNELVIETTNEATVFNGYRPGHEAMPG
ncbi:MAG: hypothetical protein WCT04_14765 [Planctomycetota bacterium]